MDIKDKIILITGAAQGIGEATARLCAGRGARVVIADFNREAGEGVAASIRRSGNAAEFERVDVRDEAEVRALMAAVRERYGHLDAMICAAGVLKGAYQQPEELALDDFETVMDVNVKGIFLCAKYGAALLETAAAGTAEPRRAGVMVVIASGAGVIVPSSSLAYGASKGGVNGLGMTLAARLAPRGIRVNVVCPGNIVTGMKLSVVAAEAERAGKPVEEALARARQEMGSPEGVARVLAFLVSEDADYVRGAIFTQ
jgi:3-oxoacyl-[acyl-carrier protein] reductase